MSEVYRSRHQSLGLLLAGCAVLVMTTVSILTAPSTTARKLVLCTVGVTLSTLYFYRCVLAGVAVGDEGLTIRNPFSTRRIAWSQVDGFSLGRRGLFPRVALVTLKDGTTVHIWGIAKRPPTLGRDETADILVETLRQRLRQGQSRESDS